MGDRRALRDAVAALTEVADAAPIGLLLFDGDGHLVMVNRRWREMTGIEDPTPIPVKVIAERIHPDDLAARPWQTLVASGEPVAIRTRLVLPDGVTRFVDVRASPLHDDTGGTAGYFAVWIDVTEAHEAEETTRRLATLVQSTSDMVAVIDVETGQFLYVNPAARDLLGVTQGEEVDLSTFELYGQSSFRRYADEILPALRKGETWTGELAMLRQDGEEIIVHQSVAAEYSTEGRVVRVSAVGHDITTQKHTEAELTHLATHDQLTGLPNRMLLLDRLEQALARSERNDSVVSLIFLDLDGLKTVNDSLGHEAGDEVLQLVARRITAVLRPGDTVARFGGDEFVALCEQVQDGNHAVAIGERLCTAIAESEFHIQDTQIPMTASAGVALSTSAESPEALLRAADAAMYQAKDLGRSRLQVFDEEMRR